MALYPAEHAVIGATTAAGLNAWGAFCGQQVEAGGGADSVGVGLDMVLPRAAEVSQAANEETCGNEGGGLEPICHGRESACTCESLRPGNDASGP